VAWVFDKRGQIYLDAAGISEEAAMEAALEAGAEDIVTEGDQHIVTVQPTELHKVREALKAAGIDAAQAEMAMIPRTTVRVEGKDAERLLRLMDALEEHDDVSKVSSNFDIDAETLAAVGE
jgi:transcriptional/translational regulatory protein YebC/TACO1